jgi:cyclophilin family peptidyl-prolyl cis-trans isomerase
MSKNDIDTSLYSLVIYQNDAFVDGLYQSMYGGKVDASTQENSKGKKKARGLKLGLGAALSLFGKGVNTDATAARSVESSDDSKTTHTMSYTQSYYLHEVRKQFHEGDGIHKLDQQADFDTIASGNFIEFRATFEKNDLVNVLDMITPQLGGVIGHVLYAKDKTDAQIVQQQAAGQFELGKSIVEALHKEFRNETSSEFYGTVIDVAGTPINVTSVLICDKQFFASGDQDRLLDGEFTVFGKVIAKSSSGLSKFERNKLLKRIKPQGKQWLTRKIAEQRNVGEYVDTAIEFDIKGEVVKVIPIAIYT